MQAIIGGFCRKKMWVANSKRKRITPKYNFVYPLGKFGAFDVFWQDYGNTALSVITMFDNRTETKFKDITDYLRLSDNLFAFKYECQWHFYNAKGDLLMEGVDDFAIDTNKRVINALAGNIHYFLDYRLKAVSPKFANLCNFDETTFSIV